MNILADASLPGLKEAFPAPFCLSYYRHPKELPALLKGQDILLCRAQLKVDASLLKHSSLRYVATASSGSDHIDKDYLKKHNITALDAKGCNAIAVTDYVLSCLAWLDEKELIKGKKVGIIGLGHVGSQLSLRLKALDFELFYYDPPRTLRDLSFKSCAQEALYQCDVLCLHAELHQQAPYTSYNLIDEHWLEKLNPKCVIINASRGGIVNEDALLKHRFTYCTDVYLNEPEINPAVVAYATLCTPHIAGHSQEAKYAAVAQISRRLHQLLQLPYPNYLRPAAPEYYQQHDGEPWEKTVLALYNPGFETELLKKAIQAREAFLELRKKHIHRHDFYTYFKGKEPYF